MLIVSPLVTWLWLGGILAAIGGLIALWPMPRARRGPERPADRGRGAESPTAPAPAPGASASSS